jgi:hypothetical protein
MELRCYHLPSAKPLVLRTYIQAFIISPFLFCCYATNLLLYFLPFLFLFLIKFIPPLILHALFRRSRVSWVSFEYHWFFLGVLASLFHELLSVGVTLADWSGTNVSYVTRKFVPSCLWKSSFGLPVVSRRIRFLLSCEGWKPWLPACGLPHSLNYLQDPFPLCVWRQLKRLKQNTVISGHQILLISSWLNGGLQDCRMFCTPSSAF